MSRPLYSTDIKRIADLGEISSFSDSDYIILFNNGQFKRILGGNFRTDAIAGTSISIGEELNNFYVDDNVFWYGGQYGIVFTDRSGTTPDGSPFTATTMLINNWNLDDGIICESYDLSGDAYNRFQMGEYNIRSSELVADTRSGKYSSYLTLYTKGVIGNTNRIVLQVDDNSKDRAFLELANTDAGTSIQMSVSATETALDINDSSGVVRINGNVVLRARDTSWTTTNMTNFQKNLDLDSIATGGGANEQVLAKTVSGIISTLDYHGLI